MLWRSPGPIRPPRRATGLLPCGESRRYQREFRPAHLAHAWSPASAGPPVQTFPMTRSSSTSCAMLSRGFMSIRPPMPCSSRSDERARIQALDRTQPFRPAPHGESQHEAHIMSTEMIIEVRRPWSARNSLSDAAASQSAWLHFTRCIVQQPLATIRSCRSIIRPSKPRCNIFKD